MDAAIPVVERGNNAVVVVPPVREAVLPLLQAIRRRPALLLALDADSAADLASGIDGAFAATGYQRATQRLAGDPPPFVAAGVRDALALLQRSALRPSVFDCVVIAWPDELDEDGRTALEAVMAECSKDAQRVLFLSAPGPAAANLTERYAFKAMTYGFPADGARPPAPAAGPARYVLARRSALPEVRRRVLDALHPENDDDVVITTCPPSREAAAALSSPDRPPVIVAEPHQLAWLRTVYAPLSPLPLPTAAAELEQRAETVRARLAKTIETENLDRELFQVGPLLERFDAATVAAAALRLAQQSVLQGQTMPARAQPEGTAPKPGGPAKIWIGVGKKDNIRPGDLVGALANEARVPADAIGKIELRELFCLVEVKGEHAEQAVKGLSGVTIRGKRLAVRMDRGPGAKPPRRV